MYIFRMCIDILINLHTHTHTHTQKKILYASNNYFKYFKSSYIRKSFRISLS